MPSGVYEHKKRPPFSKEWRENIGKARKGKHFSIKTEFKKGNVPWNKGKKGVCRYKKTKEYLRKYYRKRYKNPKIRLSWIMSTAIRRSLRGKKSGRRWEALVSYALQDLIGHLESLFDSKMNWENQGSYWHIDHIKPQSLFNYENVEDLEFKKCWALSNLQPLEAGENRKKHNSYERNK